MNSEANQEADLPNNIAFPAQPAIRLAKQATSGVFRKPEANIDHHLRQLNLFAATDTNERDLQQRPSVIPVDRQ